MLVRPETAKKLNAIHTMMSLINDSGLNYAEFAIMNLEDSEVEEIAKKYRTIVYRPSADHPHFWCRFHLGEAKVMVVGSNKKINFS